MPTRRLAHGRTVARNAHPRLRFSAAPLRHNPAVSGPTRHRRRAFPGPPVRLPAVRATSLAPGFVAGHPPSPAWRAALLRSLYALDPDAEHRILGGGVRRWTPGEDVAVRLDASVAGRARTNERPRPVAAQRLISARRWGSFRRRRLAGTTTGERVSVARLDAALSGVVRTVRFAASGRPGGRRGPEHRRRGAARQRRLEHMGRRRDAGGGRLPPAQARPDAVGVRVTVDVDAPTATSPR